MIKKKYNKSISKIADRNKKIKKIKLGFVFFVPFFLIFGLYYFSRLSYLQVSHIEVSGTETLIKDDIVNAVLESISGKKFFMFPKTNIFLVDESEITSILYTEFSRIEDLEVHKNADGVIKIEIKERQPIAIWCGDACYLLDKQGIIYSKVGNDMEKFGKTIFVGGLEGEPLMQKFKDPEVLKLYMDSVSLFGLSDIKVDSIVIESYNKVIFKTNVADVFVVLDSQNMKEEIENAILVIKDSNIKKEGSRLQYVDVRFGNKIFYK